MCYAIHMQGLAELISGQSKVKSLMAAKEGKYKLMTRSAEGCEAERQRQISKLQSLQGIMECLQEDFPSCDRELQNLSLMVKCRLSSLTVDGEVQLEEVTVEKVKVNSETL